MTRSNIDSILTFVAGGAEENNKILVRTVGVAARIRARYLQVVMGGVWEVFGFRLFVRYFVRVAPCPPYAP